MSSLKTQLHFEPFTAATTASRHPAATQPPKKKQKMSLSQTYFLAHSARGKLSSEAARPDHNLRLLVGHANLLDALMVELHEAEREQEAWLEATVQSAQSSKPASGVKWVDREMALDIPDGSDDEADSDDSDYEEEEEEEDAEFSVPIRRMRSPPPTKRVAYYDDDEADYSTDEDDEEFEDDDEADESLFLVRTESHSPDSSHHISPSSSPEVPELVSDSEPESDDESSPSSPSIPEISYAAPSPSSKTPQKPQVAQAYDEDFLHPNRQNHMVAAY